MAEVASTIGEGLKQSLLMAYEVWWALVLGFAISGAVQAWVPRERIEATLSGDGPRPVAWATGLGAASSSCSYAAIAIAKSLFQKGASAATALAFQFASTNLVWELGLVLWVLIGWQFTLAEYVGGVVLIALTALLLRRFVSPRLEESARRHAQSAQAGHVHDHGSHGHDHGSNDRGAPGHGGDGGGGHQGLGLRGKLLSADAWTEVARNFSADWQMLWKEITIGFLLAGFIGLLGNDFFNGLFITGAPGPLQTIENVLVGPLIAVLSFVCSIGNVPLAAVLWSGGIGFGGVIAFLFADLIVLPILAAYRKYYGTAFALRITALMLLTIVLAALLVEVGFGAVGLIPSGPRPSRADVFGSVELDYKLVLNVLALAGFCALLWLRARDRARESPTRPAQAAASPAEAASRSAARGS